MRIHFTNLYGMAKESIALMAQNTSTEIAKTFGANEFSIFFYDHSQEPWPEKSARFDGIVAGLGFGDVVFFFKVRLGTIMNGIPILLTA